MFIWKHGARIEKRGYRLHGSGSRLFLRVLFLFLRGQNNIAKIIDQSIDILAEETQVKHERERAAETVTMFKRNIGSCIHHQFFGKPGLSKSGILACLAYAGIMTDNFLTTDEAEKILATGYFVELKDGKYTDNSDHLRRGDILVTRTKGHTAVVLSSGDKASASEIELRLGDRLLKKGMSGSDVCELQQNMLKLGYVLPKYGADGEYGTETVEAVKSFQKKSGLEADGIYGSNTHKSLLAALESLKEPKPVLTTVVILSAEDGSVNVRAGNGTQYAILRSTRAGDTFNYVATAANGWNAVEIGGQVGWVSGRYSKII